MQLFITESVHGLIPPDPACARERDACPRWPSLLNGTYVNGTFVVEPSTLAVAWSLVFYHAMLQLLAIDDGLLKPTNVIERMMALFVVLCGALIFAGLLSAVQSASQQSKAARLEFESKLNAVRNYIKHSRPPKALCMKLLYFYQSAPPRAGRHEPAAISPRAP